jgi:hypothetical protein
VAKRGHPLDVLFFHCRCLRLCKGALSRQRVEFDDSQDLYPTRIADKLVALDSFRFGGHFDVTITNFMLTANKTQALPFVAKSRPR